MYLVFSHMLKSFDREDLETLYKLVKAKYGSTRPVEDLDLVLYGDLKTMFDPHVEDQVWKNQSDYRVLEWKLYDSCGVHSLRKQNVHIHMLVEKRYPLTPATITDMLNKKLKADHWNEMFHVEISSLVIGIGKATLCVLDSINGIRVVNHCSDRVPSASCDMDIGFKKLSTLMLQKVVIGEKVITLVYMTLMLQKAVIWTLDSGKMLNLNLF
ncbi:hypothetical protein Tco_0526722 [Tanacetum coccineum]